MSGCVETCTNIVKTGEFSLKDQAYNYYRNKELYINLPENRIVMTKLPKQYAYLPDINLFETTSELGSQTWAKEYNALVENMHRAISRGLKIELNEADFIAMRASINQNKKVDGDPSIFEWTGSFNRFDPSQEENIFSIQGLNHCYHSKENSDSDQLLASAECLIFKDKTSGEVVKSWETQLGHQVKVMPIINEVVNFIPGDTHEAYILGDNIYVPLNFDIYKADPLTAANLPQIMQRPFGVASSREIFCFVIPVSEFNNHRLRHLPINNCKGIWLRLSPVAFTQQGDQLYVYRALMQKRLPNSTQTLDPDLSEVYFQTLALHRKHPKKSSPHFVTSDAKYVENFKQSHQLI